MAAWLDVMRPAFLAVALGTLLAAPCEAQIPSYEGPGPDATFQYGDSPLQSGELRLPEGDGPFPTAIIIHGGCWINSLGKGSLTPVAASLQAYGVATWDVTYRRLGDDGAGWPGTFLDVGSAVDYLRVLAADHPIDLDRVVVVGHSSGASLAVWVGGRSSLPEDSPIRGENPLRVDAVVGIDGPMDLAAWSEAGRDAMACGQPVISNFMGGGPADVPDRYRQASPAEMPASEAHVYLTPAQMVLQLAGEDFMSQRTERTGETITVVPVPESDHFQLITPEHETAARVRETILEALGLGSGGR